MSSQPPGVRPAPVAHKDLVSGRAAEPLHPQRPPTSGCGLAESQPTGGPKKKGGWWVEEARGRMRTASPPRGLRLEPPKFWGESGSCPVQPRGGACETVRSAGVSTPLPSPAGLRVNSK